MRTNPTKLPHHCYRQKPYSSHWELAMEQGGGAGGSHADGGRAKSKLKPTDRMSPLSIQTLSKIRKNASRRRLQSAARCTVHDNNSPGYEWLLPGWVAEERYMEHGRVYRVNDPHSHLLSGCFLRAHIFIFAGRDSLLFFFPPVL